jgi:CheY-like chemotaxis protein
MRIILNANNQRFTVFSQKAEMQVADKAGQKKVHRILCAENHAPSALTLKSTLENAGYFVECVTDGKQAWERISADFRFFDLLITDHQMPLMTGLELVKKLSQTRFSGKIIVYCGQLPAEDFYSYEALAVDYIFRKPMNAAILVNLVAQMG